MTVPGINSAQAIALHPVVLSAVDSMTKATAAFARDGAKVVAPYTPWWNVVRVKRDGAEHLRPILAKLAETQTALTGMAHLVASHGIDLSPAATSALRDARAGLANLNHSLGTVQRHAEGLSKRAGDMRASQDNWSLGVNEFHMSRRSVLRAVNNAGTGVLDHLAALERSLSDVGTPDQLLRIADADLAGIARRAAREDEVARAITA